MSEFKVGQRVWSKDYKDFANVIDDSYDLSKRIRFDDGEQHSVFDIDLHQTADDMFDKLGYEKIKEDSRYTIYNLHCYEQGFITELRFDKDKNKYVLTNFTNNNNAFAGTFTTYLHLAIHQKLIEMGWL